ncbi:hypothetical protein FLONG3_3200 [Fusarium longipes]|uniref:Uncharacterized protein n=1 Tax=Fusarium longipes TaxID=694270 RepID=A0A395T1Q2_9HYPO|nr:hypothetical protein FLONG3_3200 [Fusarium longipes]
MDWHDPDCRRIDPIPFYDKLWTCQACGTIGPLDFPVDDPAGAVTSSGNREETRAEVAIRPISWPSCVDYLTDTPSDDIRNALHEVQANQGMVCSGVTHQAATVSDAYGREQSQIQQVEYPELTQPSHIRILELLPAPREKALEGRLLIADVDKPPAYAALSYTWADASNDASLCQRIFIGRGNRALPITSSCHQALRYLRRELESVFIWVDSVCINQSDLEERSYQVAMMDDVFSRASSVHAYVGEDKYGNCHPEESSKTMHQRHWEVLLAQTVVLHCADQSTPMTWDTVAKAQAHQVELPWWMNHIGRIGPYVKSELVQVLTATALCQTSDLRDKIFALLGLVDLEEATVLAADYSLMVREVYIGTAAYLIQKKGRHEILELSESLTNKDQRNTYGIPSWVPMWDLQQRPYTAADISKRLGEIQTGINEASAKIHALSMPSYTSSQPLWNRSLKSGRKSVPLSTCQIERDSGSGRYYQAVDAVTGCLITTGYEIAELKRADFIKLSNNATFDESHRENHYRVIRQGVVTLAVSGPMSTLRSTPQRVLGSSDYLALIRISGCKTSFVCDKHIRDNNVITYKIVYPCISTIIYSIGKQHLYSKHPDFDRACILEVTYPLTLDIVTFLYQWRYLMLPRGEGLATCNSADLFLVREREEAMHLYVRYAVVVEIESPSVSEDDITSWRLQLEEDPNWSSKHESSLVDNFLTELLGLQNFWDVDVFNKVAKLDLKTAQEDLDYCCGVLDTFATIDRSEKQEYRRKEKPGKVEAEISSWKAAWGLLFKRFNGLISMALKQEARLFPQTVEDIFELPESWLGTYKNKQELVRLLEDSEMAAMYKSSAVCPAPLPPTDTILSLRTGKVRPFGGVNIRSAINKRERQGKWEVTPFGLVGDEHDYVHHGGLEKALHQYCAAHYDLWNAELPGREDLFKIGGFGENLSTMNMSEQNVCIGDIYRVGKGTVKIQVTSPRQPCYKLNHRFQHKKASAMTQSTGRMGWYYRVIETGFIGQGDEIQLIERVHPNWSLACVQNYLYHEKDNYEAFRELANLPALSEEMSDIFRKRLEHGAEDMSGRLEGDRIPMVWRPYKVVSKTDLTARVKSFIFEVDGDDAKTEESVFGQFPFVRLQFGPDGSLSRAYSVVSGTTNRFELGVSRDDNSRGGSVYLHDYLKVGDVIKIAPGRNITTSQQNGRSPSQTARHIFLIGGIGVTAFLTEIEKLSNEGADVQVHYAVRSRKDAAYVERLPLNKTTLYAKDESQRLNLDQVIPQSTDENGNTSIVYCCGPTSLMSACRTITTSLNYPKDNAHFEDFGDATTGTGEPFEVEIKSTGQTIQVPREKSLLQVLSDAGFEIESSCLVGNCGTCMVDVCKGEVEHKGLALGEEQKKESMLSCNLGRSNMWIESMMHEVAKEKDTD